MNTVLFFEHTEEVVVEYLVLGPEVESVVIDVEVKFFPGYE
jgi:hypothetical protein